MSGCVAGGHALTVAAGVAALEAGGNAVDAAVAAQLTACVVEPLLTGLGGGGLALTWMGGRAEVCDFFATVPRGPSERTPVELDFGPTTQTFAVGPGSVAVPGMPAGLYALHQQHGRVPLRMLAQPAIEAAEVGFEASVGFARVNRLLWPIQQLDPAAAQLLGPQGRPIREGERFANPPLAETLRAFVRHGKRVFREGPVAEALHAAAPGLEWKDLREYAPAFRPALEGRHGKATVYTPGPPSQGGPQILRALKELVWVPDGRGTALVEAIARAMDSAERSLPDPLVESLFREDFVPSYLGNTTHISAVDGDGNACAITSSLGETAGILVPGTGLLLNNFLGEDDVNPPGHPRPPGARLMTMCSPTLIRWPGATFALGSGGSSRIRSAVLHGIVYLVDQGLSPQQAAEAPRCHMEAGVLKVESFDRPPGTLEELRVAHPELVDFDHIGMYFGGLHIAGLTAEGFAGGGDPRRSGSAAVV